MQLFPMPQGPVQGYLDTIDHGQAGPRVKERRPLGKDLDHAPNVGSVRHRELEVTAGIINGGGEHAMDGHAYAHVMSHSRVGVPIFPLSQAAGTG